MHNTNDTLLALGLNNEGCKASLEVGKLYRIIPDSEVEKHGYLRIVDKSGEEYAFTSSRFFPVTLPQNIRQTLLKSTDSPM